MPRTFNACSSRSDGSVNVQHSQDGQTASQRLQTPSHTSYFVVCFLQRFKRLDVIRASPRRGRRTIQRSVAPNECDRPYPHESDFTVDVPVMKSAHLSLANL